jgi:hypothetical protein
MKVKQGRNSARTGGGRREGGKEAEQEKRGSI